VQKDYSNFTHAEILGDLYSATEPKLVLLTGPSGSGKTTWCMELAKWAGSLGLDVDGLVSPSIYQDGIRTGIQLFDLQTGHSRLLAHRRTQHSDGFTTADWQLNDETLQWGNHILAGCQTGQVFILDELGPLEFERGCGMTNGLDVIDQQRYQFACAVVRPAFLSLATSRWPAAKVIALQEYHS
jgi:nucleoside-triphosphatase THEP1